MTGGMLLASRGLRQRRCQRPYGAVETSLLNPDKELPGPHVHGQGEESLPWTIMLSSNKQSYFFLSNLEAFNFLPHYTG